MLLNKTGFSRVIKHIKRKNLERHYRSVLGFLKLLQRICHVYTDPSYSLRIIDLSANLSSKNDAENMNFHSQHAASEKNSVFHL